MESKMEFAFKAMHPYDTPSEASTYVKYCTPTAHTAKLSPSPNLVWTESYYTKNFTRPRKPSLVLIKKWIDITDQINAPPPDSIDPEGILSITPTANSLPIDYDDNSMETTYTPLATTSSTPTPAPITLDPNTFVTTITTHVQPHANDLPLDFDADTLLDSLIYTSAR
jgi:hypothetical protein